jgi:hypothetical protein
MKSKRIRLVLAVAVAVLAKPVFAQSDPPARPVLSPPVAYHHASTWEEGVMRGAGDVFRAVGEARYNSSLALVNGQEAYSRYLDNRLKAVSTYFEVQNLNREYRAEKRGQRATEEDLARYAKDRAPDRMAAHELDPTANRIVWPEALNDARFDAPRTTIDSLIARRGAGAENREVQQLAESMIEELRTHVREMKPADYVAAKRFLTSLHYEMEFAPGAAAVALR